MCSPQRLLLLLQDKDKELEELLQEIQCEKVPSLTVVPWVECILELETQVQILALSFSPSLQRLKQRQHPNSPSLWNLCVGICRHNFGAKRQRTVASVCRSRYLLAPQVEKEGAGAWQAKGSCLTGYHIQEGFSPKYYGVLAAKDLVLQRDPGTRARAGGLGTLLGSDCVRFREPITSSLRPSVLLLPMGRGWSQMLLASVNQGL